MRLCNWVVVDEKGERPLGSSAAIECNRLAALRFETAFFFEAATLAILWSDDEGRTLLTESVAVNRDTVAVFLPIPSYLSTSLSTFTLKFRICESTQCFKTLTLSIAHPARSRLALYAFVRKEQNRYFALYDWLRGLPFEEMLGLTQSALSAKGARLIFVTGSVGKTSTKEIIAHLLRYENVYHSTDSWNYPHEICAQIMLNLNWARIFVMEVAVGNHLRTMGELLPPSILVFTHLGMVHTAQFASVLDIGLAKAALAACMPPSSTVVFNADIPEISQALHAVWRHRADHPQTLSFSITGAADATVLSERDAVSRAITLHDRRINQPYTIDVSNSLKVHHGNLAAAYCACTALELADFNIREALKTFQGVPRRLEIESLGKTILINDAYNANPISMREFLTMVHRYRISAGPACVVLGEMVDLGAFTLEQHRIVLQYAQVHADFLVLVGRTYEKLDAEKQATCAYFATWQDMLQANLLPQLIERYTVIGVKGSYSTGMLHVAAEIKQLLIASVG